LPQGWAICTLSTIGQIIGGGTPKTDILSYWNNGTIPWITPADLSGYQKKFIANGSRMITKNGLATSSAQILPKGSVLFSSRAPIGYTVIAAANVCTNQGFKSIVPYIDGASEFLYYFLKARIEEIRSRASGTTFKEISGTEMGKTLIFLPPLEEQKQIITAIENSFEWLNIIFRNISRDY
jgi:type I restriction enzyme S subunit